MSMAAEGVTNGPFQFEFKPQSKNDTSDSFQANGKRLKRKHTPTSLLAPGADPGDKNFVLTPYPKHVIDAGPLSITFQERIEQFLERKSDLDRRRTAEMKTLEDEITVHFHEFLEQNFR